MPRPFVVSLSCTALALCAACAEDVERGEPPRPPVVDAGEPLPPPAIELTTEEIALPAPLDRPTSLAFLPGTDGEFLVLEQRSRVAHYALAGDQAELLGSFEVEGIFTDRDCGLIALAIDPDFERNHLLYVSACLSATQCGVYRVTLDASDYDATAASVKEIIVAGDERAMYGIHNVGSIGFDSKGSLWVLFGDKTESGNARNTSSNLGGVVRIVPNREPDGEGYEPAPDNPYPENPDLYAKGLRSPWRGVMDRFDRLWVGDVGADTTEELDLMVPGGYHGWPDYEGPCTKSCGELVDPVTSWTGAEDDAYTLDDVDAASTTRRVAWVGGVYDSRRSEADPYDGKLEDRVLFGDMCLGFLRLLDVDARGETVHDVHVGHLGQMTGADQAPDGYFYVTVYGSCMSSRGTHPGGRLLRLLPASGT